MYAANQGSFRVGEEKMPVVNFVLEIPPFIPAFFLSFRVMPSAGLQSG